MEDAVEKTTKKKGSTWDNLGLLFSSLCLVHCILLPFLIIAFPTVAGFFVKDAHISHTLLLIFILPAAGFAIYTGYNLHGQVKPLILILIGTALVAFGAIYGDKVFGHNHLMDTGVVILGSLFLVAGHLLNKNHCKKCAEDHHCLWEPHNDECDHEH